LAIGHRDIASLVAISNSLNLLDIPLETHAKLARQKKAMDSNALNLNSDLNAFMTSTPNEVIPILCGTFTSVYLYILSFSTLTRKLSIHKRVPAVGPHQYLALSPGRDTLYATGWGWTPGLYAFGIKDDDSKDKQDDDDSKRGEEEDQPWRLTLDYKGKTPISKSTETYPLYYLFTVISLHPNLSSFQNLVRTLITTKKSLTYLAFRTHPQLTAAISSYITIHENYIYSIGGPTGEVHAAPTPSSSLYISSSSESEVQDASGDQNAGNGFGRKVQEMVYVPEDMLGGWEKTNKALVSRKSTLSTSRTSDTDT
jgi:hypothetical protein